MYSRDTKQKCSSDHSYIDCVKQVLLFINADMYKNDDVYRTMTEICYIITGTSVGLVELYWGHAGNWNGDSRQS